MKLTHDLVIYGSQGSGKTTQAQILTEKFGVRFFSMGFLMRKLAKKDQGLQILLNQGKMLPDVYFEKMVIKFIDWAHSGTQIVFEGVARNLDQQRFFVEMMRKRQRDFKVIFIKVSDEEARWRLQGRRENHEQDREDEYGEALEERLRIFREETLPVIDQFQKDGFDLLTIDGDVSREEVTKQILRGLGV